MPHKAADLDSLIRLKRWYVDERRRALAALMMREEQLHLERAGLDRQMTKEASVVAADPTQAGFAFGLFAQGHRLRREQLERHIVAIKEEIEVAREQLAEAFRERQVFDEVKKQRARHEREEENRLAQIELDEIAQTQYQRKGG
jgi:flagellar export protein FliJ